MDGYNEREELEELRMVESEEQEAQQEIETEQAETGINYQLDAK